MEQIQLYTKINYLPADLKTEVNDFIDFLLSKKQKNQKRKYRNSAVLKVKFIFHQILTNRWMILKNTCNEIIARQAHTYLVPEW